MAPDVRPDNPSTRSSWRSVTVPTWLACVVSTSLLCLLVSVAVNILQGRLGLPYHVDQELLEDLGQSGVGLFRQYDRDQDGYLSMDEFEPLAHKLLEGNISAPEIYNLVIEEWDDVFTIHTAFQPLLQETMTKEMGPDSWGSTRCLNGLKSWKQAVVGWKNFAASSLKALLPTKPSLLDTPGEVYTLVEGSDSMVSSNRYYPPRLNDPTAILIHEMLSMFHPRPFVQSRFPPAGAVACVRATNENFVNIVFRVHAEFQLNEPPFLPFWFTPAQFTGQVTLRRDASKVLYLNLSVPSDRQLNVDMEWLTGQNDEEKMEVDIGFLPQMELKSTSWSELATEGGVDRRGQPGEAAVDYQQSLDELVWTQQISLEECHRKLQVEMYPFTQVQYHKFSDAFPLAAKEGKLVHSVLLWGTLDDQAC